MRDALQHALESGSSVMIVGREIRTAKEWAAIRSEKRGQWPAALSTDGLNSRLVARIHIGTLITINFYSNEIFVDKRRQLRIVVRFAVHYMAPMAPHRADVEQDGLVFISRLRECCLTPFMPAYRLVHRRTKIGRRCLF